MEMEGAPTNEWKWTKLMRARNIKGNEERYCDAIAQLHSFGSMSLCIFKNKGKTQCYYMEIMRCFHYFLSFEQSVFNLFDIRHPETPFLLILSMQVDASFENEKLGYVANQELS